jgi:hypothetical protein
LITFACRRISALTISGKTPKMSGGPVLGIVAGDEGFYQRFVSRELPGARKT